MKKPNIAIIGYGRFGKLLVKLLKPYGNIFFVHRKRLDLKAIKQIKTRDLDIADWVIPAVPISSLIDVLKQIKPYLRPGCLVMDVCSVKVKPCEWLKIYLSKDTELLGTHPMFGPDSAKHGLKGLPVIICPIRIKTKTLKTVVGILKNLDLKIINTSPQEHDKQAAISLALVHFIGRGLSGVGVKKQHISSLGFERLLSVNETVTNDSWQLFYDMHQYNPYTRHARKQYLNSLSILDRKINNVNK